jgi:hypothetical protein
MGILEKPLSSLLALFLVLRGMRTRQEGGILPFLISCQTFYLPAALV